MFWLFCNSAIVVQFDLIRAKNEILLLLDGKGLRLISGRLWRTSSDGFQRLIPAIDHDQVGTPVVTLYQLLPCYPERNALCTPMLVA